MRKIDRTGETNMSITTIYQKENRNRINKNL